MYVCDYGDADSFRPQGLVYTADVLHIIDGGDSEPYHLRPSLGESPALLYACCFVACVGVAHGLYHDGVTCTEFELPYAHGIAFQSFIYLCHRQFRKLPV